MNVRRFALWKSFLVGILCCLGCRPLSVPEKQNAADDAPFTLIVLPDTQIYSKDCPEWRRSSRKEVFIQQTEWIAQNAKRENIRFVLHMGDIVQDQDQPRQWDNADQALRLLDGAVPYYFAVGNHDMVLDATRNTTCFNETFPYARYEKKPWYGSRMNHDGFPPQDNYDNCYHFFRGGGTDFLVVSLECGPTDEMLAWANGVIASHPDKSVIVLTHSYMRPEDRRDDSDYYIPPVPPANTGEQIWQKLIKKHTNIFLVLSGHHGNSTAHRGLLASTGDNGNTVYQLLSGEWYDGWLRLLRFMPREHKIEVKSYSPWTPQNPNQQYQQYDTPLPGYNTDLYHQYEIPFPP